MAESKVLSVALADVGATETFGERLAEAITETAVGAPLLVSLAGPLGAGKTTLVRSFLRALGHAGPVRSPTYTLVETYTFAQFKVAHLDLYRLGDGDELEFLGYRDFVADGWIRLVEWPERGGRALGEADLALTIEYCGDGRTVAWTARPGPGAAIADRLVRRLPESAQ